MDIIFLNPKTPFLLHVSLVNQCLKIIIPSRISLVLLSCPSAFIDENLVLKSGEFFFFFTSLPLLQLFRNQTFLHDMLGTF